MIVTEASQNVDILTKRYIPEAIFTSQSWPEFVPCQETKMVAVQIPFIHKLQTNIQETYYTTLKYKNEIIFVPSFVFIGLFLRPRCFRKDRVKF